MDRIGKRQVGDFVNVSMDAQGNTSSTTTNASEERATTSGYVPRQGLGKRRIMTMPDVNKASDESGYLSLLADVVCANGLSGASSSATLRLSQCELGQNGSKKSRIENKHNTEIVSAIEAPNSGKKNYLSEMHAVIESENWLGFNNLISATININTPDKPLTYLVRENLTKMCEKGVKLNSDTAIQTLIAIFIRNKREDLVKIFLPIGSSSLRFQLGEYIFSSLGYACLHGYIDVVNLLLKNESDINGNASKETYAPIICAIKGRNFDCVKALLVNGANANYGNARCHELNPLCLAAYIGEAFLVELLLDYGSKAIQSDGSRWWEDPLSCAAYRGSIACVNFLLSKGSRVDGNGKSSRTPLGCAALKGNVECMSLLLSCNANVDGGEVTAPLLSAIYGSDLGVSKKSRINIDVVRLLLRKGANPNIKDLIHGAALSKAVHKNDARCVDLLLQYGAIVKPSIAPSLLKLALTNKNPDIAMNLILKGAKLDGLNADIFNKLLKEKKYDNKPPLSLRALCLRRLRYLTYGESVQKPAGAVTNLEIPESLQKLLNGDDESAFFQC